jgi:putative oxidoreductase
MFDSVGGQPPSRLRLLLQKLPTVQQVGVGLLFVFIGWGKFDSDPRRMWVQIFDEIGLGQWFRYLTGVMQVGGGILMVFRKTMTAGAAMLAYTMRGAAFVDVVMLQEPVFIIPLLLFIVIAPAWATSR